MSDGSSGASSTEDALDEVSDAGSVDEFAQDRSIFWFDDDLREAVTRLIRQDEGDDHCLQGKAADRENFLCSLSHMTPKKRNRVC